MQLKLNVKNDLEKLNNKIDLILDNNFLEEKHIMDLLYNLEKTRYAFIENIEEIIMLQKNSLVRQTEFQNQLNNQLYNIVYSNKILHITCYEKSITIKDIQKATYNFAYKRIQNNIAILTKPYANLFNKKMVFICFNIYKNRKNWDIDNQLVKHFIDGFVDSHLIYDDNICNFYYLVKGHYSKNERIEIKITDSNLLHKKLKKLLD